MQLHKKKRPADVEEDEEEAHRHKKLPSRRRSVVGDPSSAIITSTAEDPPIDIRAVAVSLSAFTAAVHRGIGGRLPRSREMRLELEAGTDLGAGPCLPPRPPKKASPRPVAATPVHAQLCAESFFLRRRTKKAEDPVKPADGGGGGLRHNTLARWAASAPAVRRAIEALAAHGGVAFDPEAEAAVTHVCATRTVVSDALVVRRVVDHGVLTEWKTKRRIALRDDLVALHVAWELEGEADAATATAFLAAAPAAILPPGGGDDDAPPPTMTTVQRWEWQAARAPPGVRAVLQFRAAAVSDAATGGWRFEVEAVPPAVTAAHAATLCAIARVARGRPGPTATITPPPLADYARAYLADLCADLGVPCRGAYPRQARPRDLLADEIATCSALLRCVATPKANGSEAFLLGYPYGAALVLRDGTVHTYHCQQPQHRRFFPLLIEGELLEPTGAPPPLRLLLAYDCLCTPRMAYAAHGRHATRAAALAALLPLSFEAVDGGPPLRVCQKPLVAPVLPHPWAAVHAAAEGWPAATGIPCDGVIFALDDADAPYVRVDRLWKLKHTPTLDCVVVRCAATATAAVAGCWELMLRQDRHDCLLRGVPSRFRYRDAVVEAPLLLRPPAGAPPLSDGDVVELAVERAEGGPVRFVSMQLRADRGRANPNTIRAALDLLARGASVAAVLADPAIFVRLLVRGPIRRARAALLRRCGAPRQILEVGGGCGGDVAMWLDAAAVAVVEVIDPDVDALLEYRRRLVDAHGAIVRRDESDALLVHRRHNGVVRFRLHPYAIADLEPWVGRGADAAFLHFSASQIISGPDAAAACLTDLLGARAIRQLAVLAHDHAATGLPHPAHDHGVRIRVEAPAVCPRACDPSRRPAGACACPGATAARLGVTVDGSRTACGIHEYAFDAAALVEVVDRLVCDGSLPATTAAYIQRPYARVPGAHWLLRSLVLVYVVVTK